MSDCLAIEQAEPPVLPAGMTMYCLSVKTRRIITTSPVKEAQTIEAEWVIGNLPGFSEMHVRRVYWDNCPHHKPKLLDRNGVPLAKGRIKKMAELIVRVVPQNS